MLYINKYKPTVKNLKKSYFHKDVLAKLESMSKDDCIPHIIFYGPEGCGKRTLINILLEMIYDKYVHNIAESIYNVTGSGNNVTEVPIKQSNYHIVIEPGNNNFDRYLIQDIVKEYARRVPLGIFTKKKHFKTVLINNIDNLSYYAQTSLRRTMEIYSGTCRFIMWCNSLSKVIDPLKSRCYCFRVKAPKEEELFEFLLDVCSKEQMLLTLPQFLNIIDISERNIKKSLWLLELHKHKESTQTTYDEIIEEIIKLIAKPNLKNINVILEKFYKIIITNISGTQIIKDITKKLLKLDSINLKSKIAISEQAAKYEHNIVKARREIIHLQGFIVSIFRLLQ